MEREKWGFHRHELEAPAKHLDLCGYRFKSGFLLAWGKVGRGCRESVSLYSMGGMDEETFD